jgi:integrase
LLEWRLASGRPGDEAVVIPRPSDCEAMSARTFNQWRGDVFVPALAAAGLPHARPYDLRHSYASLLLHEGRSVVYVARQLSHSAKVCLDDYAHVIDELEDMPQLPAEDAIRRARHVRTEYAGRGFRHPKSAD